MMTNVSPDTPWRVRAVSAISSPMRGLGVYPSSCAAARTRSRVASEIRPSLRNACETVIRDTPTRSAMFFRLITIFLGFIFSSRGTGQLISRAEIEIAMSHPLTENREHIFVFHEFFRQPNA